MTRSSIKRPSLQRARYLRWTVNAVTIGGLTVFAVRLDGWWLVLAVALLTMVVWPDPDTADAAIVRAARAIRQALVQALGRALQKATGRPEGQPVTPQSERR